MSSYRFEAELWKSTGKGAWHFVTVPPEVGFEVRAQAHGATPGWGMVKVAVEIAGRAFETSIFPDKQSGSYLLPIRADIRKANKLAAGDVVPVQMKILV